MNMFYLYHPVFLFAIILAYTFTTTSGKKPILRGLLAKQNENISNRKATLSVTDDENHSVICQDEKFSLVSVHIKTDAYPEEVSWRLESNGEIMDEVVMEQYDKANHIYTHEMCVSSRGCFDFTVKDSYGDGICCSHGYGYFEVLRDNKVMVFSGNKFGSEFSETYCPSFSEDEYEAKKFVASDSNDYDYFGESCSISDDLIVIGAYESGRNKTGAAYLFHSSGTEIKKLTPVDGGGEEDYFGYSLSADEKLVVGSVSDYFQVFSLKGQHERTIKCHDCSLFGSVVATYGNLIAVHGKQNSSDKLFIYTTAGQLLKTLDHGADWIMDLAISADVIIATSTSRINDGKTVVYSNSSPDFPKIVEIPQGGASVATSGDRLVIGLGNVNDKEGNAWLYKTDGTLIKELEFNSTRDSYFGNSVDITAENIVVGANEDDEDGIDAGSVFIYSAKTGEFQEKISRPEGSTLSLVSSLFA
eukprot:CAMPEP_0178960638 /NCGR_PEP_ID=MMETSP0789-20121207/13086_1 /TAXON_ID=3005 /ORGANISM="Rhizosolenia setigera, Strain CCMP 1694" /LENGTH=472 /DNA_ID=CAMNT_0020644031 /DNA_START=101 /DNA_END=1519 /DNA_ORIENTATION=-